MKNSAEKQSIKSIEQKISSLKESKPQTKQAKAEIDKWKSELNKKYTENKKRVAEFEKTNFEFLIFMRSTNDFYKLFGHSALYYAYSIAPKLGLRANLMSDKDFTAKSEDGFVSVVGLEKISEALRTLKIEKTKTKYDSGDFVVFKIPWKFTEKQLAEYKEHNVSKMQKFNHVVLVDNVVPVLFLEVEELMKAVYENVRSVATDDQ